jgi:hypothetical protein
MLTEKHLAIVRAALKFLDEEMSPSGIDALFHYLDSEGQSIGVSLDDLQDARQFFGAVDLSYVLVDSTGVAIESERLIAASSNAELSFQSDLSLLASVLVPIR